VEEPSTASTTEVAFSRVAKKSRPKAALQT
jgi:hypothetical protein